MFLFFSVARSPDNGHWERAEAAQPVVPVKTAKNTAPTFAPHMPVMSSAFDTSSLLAVA
jgi:hypothetical protein